MEENRQDNLHTEEQENNLKQIEAEDIKKRHTNSFKSYDIFKEQITELPKDKLPSGQRMTAGAPGSLKNSAKRIRGLSLTKRSGRQRLRRRKAARPGLPRERPGKSWHRQGSIRVSAADLKVMILKINNPPDRHAGREPIR